MISSEFAMPLHLRNPELENEILAGHGLVWRKGENVWSEYSAGLYGDLDLTHWLFSVSLQ